MFTQTGGKSIDEIEGEQSITSDPNGPDELLPGFDEKTTKEGNGTAQPSEDHPTSGRMVDQEEEEEEEKQEDLIEFYSEKSDRNDVKKEHEESKEEKFSEVMNAQTGFGTKATIYEQQIKNLGPSPSASSNFSQNKVHPAPPRDTIIRENDKKEEIVDFDQPKIVSKPTEMETELAKLGPRASQERRPTMPIAK